MSSRRGTKCCAIKTQNRPLSYTLSYTKANELCGLVSGEHGIGFAKKQYMLDTYGEGQIGLMRGIKRVFNPKGILNPGKLF